MLYARWREVSREMGGELALADLGSGRRWSFAELREAAEGMAGGKEMTFPRGSSAEFILQVLAGWREGGVVCPLELGQPVPEVARPPENCVHLKVTSATSGAPKLIAFRGEQLAADARNIVATMGLRREWPNLGAISLAHSYGFSNLVLPLLLHGVPLILVPAPLPEMILRGAALAERVTAAAVPALWKAWHEGNGFPENVALAISAGAPLPLALEEEILRKRGVKIHNFYGSSECGGIAFDRSAGARTDGTLAGSALEGVKLSLNEQGTLVVESEAVGEGYWPEGSPKLGRGQFETSDLAELKDGLVYLKGRAGDVINVAGRKVSPETIEAALRMHPAVRECVVFGVPDEDGGRFERIVGCVAGRGKVDGAELAAYLAGRLPGWQVPRQWWFVEELEPNQRGKLSRAERRKAWLARGGI